MMMLSDKSSPPPPPHLSHAPEIKGWEMSVHRSERMQKNLFEQKNFEREDISSLMFVLFMTVHLIIDC
jgi:hypothetical protein